jgi:hypothetical protein
MSSGQEGLGSLLLLGGVTGLALGGSSDLQRTENSRLIIKRARGILATTVLLTFFCLFFLSFLFFLLVLSTLGARPD